MSDHRCPSCGGGHGHPQIDADLYAACKMEKTRKDSARLDWLERKARQRCDNTIGCYLSLGGSIFIDDEGRFDAVASGPTLRDAIDAAMALEGGE